MSFQWGPKSVITFPSGGQQLPGPGIYQLTGLAWSGGGVIRKVEVSTDGGQTWKEAEIRGAVHPNGAHPVWHELEVGRKRVCAPVALHR